MQQQISQQTRPFGFHQDVSPMYELQREEDSAGWTEFLTGHKPARSQQHKARSAPSSKPSTSNDHHGLGSLKRSALYQEVIPFEVQLHFLVPGCTPLGSATALQEPMGFSIRKAESFSSHTKSRLTLRLDRGLVTYSRTVRGDHRAWNTSCCASR